MKKLLALLLAVVLCLSLVACSSDKGKELVGSWKKGSWIIVFHEDGTGLDPDGKGLTWHYNTEKELYVVTFLAHSEISFEITIETDDDGKEFITVKGVKYYRKG